MRLQLAMTLAGIQHAAELAEEIDVRPQTVNVWLHNDNVHIDSHTLFALEDRLRVAARWILLGKGGISPPRALSHTQASLLQRFDALPEAAQAAYLAQLTYDSALAQSTT